MGACISAMTLQFSPRDGHFDEQLAPKVAILSPADTSTYAHATKRALDIALTVLSLPLVVPAIALMAVLIALDGHNPFYSQMRVGRGGRVFRMWKLRTMVHNAENLLETYLAENPQARDEWDRTQKLKIDPRTTWIGRTLRKTSLDELPQLWNVLNGTMSLVGPRPMMVSQQYEYSGQSYYNHRPGITGPWQVSERNQSDFDARVHYDDLYDRTVSLDTDFRILAKTVFVVLRGTGY